MLAGVRLVMDLLLHEVPVVALLHQGGGRRHEAHRALGGLAGLIEDLRAVVVDGDVIAFFQIGDAVGEGPHRQGVGAQEHLAVAIGHHQRAASASPHDQGVLALNQHRQGIGAGEPVQGGLQGRDRGQAGVKLGVQQLGDHLGIGLALEDPAGRLQALPEFGVVLNDAVVHQGDAAGLVRVGVALGGDAVGGPAGMADADGGLQRIGGQHLLKRPDLALGAAALDLAAHHAGDPGRIIAAVFQPLQAVDQPLLHRPRPDDADDPAHLFWLPLW